MGFEYSAQAFLERPPYLGFRVGRLWAGGWFFVVYQWEATDSWRRKIRFMC